MTAAEPPPGAAIDWEALLAVDDEAEALDRAGKLDIPTFRTLWARAKAAAGGQIEQLESLRMRCPASLNPKSL